MLEKSAEYLYTCAVVVSMYLAGMSPAYTQAFYYEGP